MICLDDLSGLWHRRSIAWPDGRSDTATEVYWLQGPRRYADLRVPAGRPTGPDIGCLRELNWPMLEFMARQEGFFGHLDVADGVGHWYRAFDYQPDTGIADRGALAFDNDILVERGVDVPYVEQWSRETGTENAAAFALAADDGASGCLVVAGDAFIYARGRAARLPHGATLDQRLGRATSLQAAQDIFDCEISFGRRQDGNDAGDWRIARSSHCFREGAALAPEVDATATLLVVGDVTADGVPFRRMWRITGYESATATPLSHWFARRWSRGAVLLAG